MVFKSFSFLSSPWIQPQRLRVTVDHWKTYRISFPLLLKSHFSVIRVWDLSDRSRFWSPCGPQIHRILQALHLRGWPVAGAGNRESWRTSEQSDKTQSALRKVPDSKRVVKILKQGFYLLSKIHIVLIYNDSRYFCYPCKCSIPFDCCWNDSNLKWKIKYLCLVERGYCKKRLDEIKADELQAVQEEEIPRQWDVLNNGIKL